MLRERIELIVEHVAKKAELHKGLDDKLNAAVKERTGLKHDNKDVNWDLSRSWEVTLTGLEDGKPSDQLKYSATSTMGINEAIDAALVAAEKDLSEKEGKEVKGFDYDPSQINVKLTRAVDVHYFVEALVVSALDKERAKSAYDAQVDQLAKTYGGRLSGQPLSTTYTIVKTRKGYKNDTNIPRDGFTFRDKDNHIKNRKGVIAIGSSNVSFEEAEGKTSTKSRSVKSTVYEMSVQLRIYGQPVKQDAERILEGAAYVVAGSKTAVSGARAYARSGSTSAREPVSLESAASF